MKHNLIKIVITSKNHTQYYKGNGFWFGRISKSDADKALANGAYIYETINHNIIEFKP